MIPHKNFMKKGSKTALKLPVNSTSSQGYLLLKRLKSFHRRQRVKTRWFRMFCMTAHLTLIWTSPRFLNPSEAFQSTLTTCLRSTRSSSLTPGYGTKGEASRILRRPCSRTRSNSPRSSKSREANRGRPKIPRVPRLRIKPTRQERTTSWSRFLKPVLKTRANPTSPRPRLSLKTTDKAGLRSLISSTIGLKWFKCTTKGMNMA